MSKLYLDLRALSAVPDPYLATTEDIMSYSGINVGNFAFRHALKSLININEYKVVDYTAFNHAVAKEKPKSVVISCANWLCATEQYEKSNAVWTHMEGYQTREVKRSLLEPQSTQHFCGYDFYAPAKIEAFLEDRYGKGWSKPDPTFEL